MYLALPVVRHFSKFIHEGGSGAPRILVGSFIYLTDGFRPIKDLVLSEVITKRLKHGFSLQSAQHDFGEQKNR